MASELFSTLSSDEVAQRLRNERMEPDFAPPSVPRPMTRRGKLTQIPEASSPSRYSHLTRLPLGMLLYLASVALVAAVITGSFFGTGFSLLQSTASKVITDFNRNPRVDAKISHLVRRGNDLKFPTTRHVAPWACLRTQAASNGTCGAVNRPASYRVPNQQRRESQTWLTTNIQ